MLQLGSPGLGVLFLVGTVPWQLKQACEEAGGSSWGREVCGGVMCWGVAFRKQNLHFSLSAWTKPSDFPSCMGSNR